MKNNKPYILGAIMLSIGILSGAALSVSADTNSINNIQDCPIYKKFDNKANDQGAKHFKNNEIKKAINNNDYAAWREAINKQRPITKIINSEDKFNEFVKMHKLFKEGKHEEAKIIKDYLGINHYKKNSLLEKNN